MLYRLVFPIVSHKGRYIRIVDFFRAESKEACKAEVYEYHGEQPISIDTIIPPAAYEPCGELRERFEVMYERRRKSRERPLTSKEILRYIKPWIWR